MAALTPLALKVVDAYGGEDMWRMADKFTCRISAGGWAFRMRMRSAMKNVACTARVGQPHLTFEPWYGNARSVFEGDSVRLESKSGKVKESRKDPRRFFPGGRRAFRWDDIDLAYFASYACWNYNTFPRLLLRDDVAWSQLSDTTLEAIFPDSVPTHSPVQQFHFDAATNLLRQHDYTARVFGDWAAAANVVVAHGRSPEGIPYTSHRRVTPRKKDGTPRPFPLLVDIRVDDWRLT